MSHIDSFEHEFVGLFAGLPVYHPLENIEGEFYCNESQLLLGGGSGEHPALLIKNPLSAVALFLSDELDLLEGDDVSVRAYPLKRHLEEWRSVIKDHIRWDADDNLEFFEWSVDTYKSFYDRCVSESLEHPYYEDSSDGFEQWLILGFGEFIFFAMPELVLPIIAKLNDPYRYFHYSKHNNVLVVPKNIPVSANAGNAFKFK